MVPRASSIYMIIIMVPSYFDIIHLFFVVGCCWAKCFIAKFYDVWPASFLISNFVV